MKKEKLTKIIDCPCQCGQIYKSDVVIKDKQIYRIKVFVQEFSNDKRMITGDVIRIILHECPKCNKK